MTKGRKKITNTWLLNTKNIKPGSTFGSRFQSKEDRKERDFTDLGRSRWQPGWVRDSRMPLPWKRDLSGLERSSLSQRFVFVFVCLCLCVCGKGLERSSLSQRFVFVFVCLCLWQRFGAVFFVAKVNNSLTSDYIFEIEWTCLIWWNSNNTVLNPVNFPEFLKRQ